MKSLDENMMKNLSFPDFNVEKIEFFPEQKSLKIFVEGAWLDIDGGHPLGKGVLCFNEWEQLSISRFNPDTEKWSKTSALITEQLNNICEMKFSASTIYLYGFGQQIGHWMEWKILKAKAHAEFSD